VVVTVAVDIGKKHVGAILGAVNTAGSIGGFLFSVSFGYFVKWFGSYDLALIPVAFMLTIGTLLWFKVDATEELIPEPVAIPATVVPVLT
jgi:nitrate/nitrite transporter NarK